MLNLTLNSNLAYEDDGTTVPQQYINSMALAGGTGYPVVSTGNDKQHSCRVGDYIFVANAGDDTIKLYQPNESAAPTLLDTFDVTTLSAPANSVNISDHAYPINHADSIAAFCYHSSDLEVVFDCSGGTITHVATVSMADTSGSANTGYLSDNNVLRYSGGSAVPEDIQQYTWNSGSNTFTDSGDAYTTDLTNTSQIQPIGLSATKAALVDATQGEVYTIERTGSTWAQVGSKAGLRDTIVSDERGTMYDENTLILPGGAKWLHVYIWDEDNTKWKFYGPGIDLTLAEGGSDVIYFPDNNDRIFSSGDHGANAELLALDLTISTTARSNPIPALVDEYWSAEDYDNITITSGTEISTVSPVKGAINLEAIGSPDFAPDAFDGWGGFVFNAATDGLRHASNFTATNTQTVGFVTDMGTYTSLLSIMSYASGTGSGDTSARIGQNGAGELRFYTNQGGSSVELYDSGTDEKVIVILRFTDNSDLDSYVNSTAPNNFDPDNDYGTLTRIRWGDRTGAGDTTAGAIYNDMFRVSSALSDANIDTIVSYLADKYDITYTQPSVPANTVLPTIDNTTPSVGDTLTVSNGTWTGLPTPTFTYQWQDDGVNISGATSSTYTVQAAEEGGAITCEVTGINSEGSAMAETAATSAVTAGSSYMQGVEATCEMDCDATISDSADGTTANWLNLVSSPSEGAQADYDLLGSGGIVSGDFTGTAGDSGAYWDKAATGEYFAIRNMANTTLRKMCHTGTSGGSWWVAMVFRHGTSSAQVPWGNAYVSADRGVYWLSDENGWRRIYLANTSSLTNVSNSNANQDYGTTSDVFWCLTADMSASTNNARFCMGTYHLLLPWAVGGTNSSTDSTLDFFVGAANSTSSPPRAGISSSRLKAFSFGYASDNSAFLTEAKINAIRSEYDTRHSTTY